MIFIHGLGQSPSAWKQTISLLEAEATCPDLSGFLPEQQPTYQEMYQNFVKYCSSFSGKLDLCGLSLGAVLALHYACSYPERVNSLILIAGQYKMPKGLLKFQNLLFRLMPNSNFTQIGFSKEQMISLTSSMRQLNFSDSLSQISCPTLILCGEKDRVNQKASKEMNQKIKSSTFSLIAQSGHEVNKDAPQELAKRIKQFYQSKI